MSRSRTSRSTGATPRLRAHAPNHSSENSRPSLEAATELAGLNPAAHGAAKLRARAAALGALRSAIETELTTQNLGAAQAPS